MSKVEIVQDKGQTFVRKSGNVGRNLERLDALSRYSLPLPKVLEIYGDSYDMEYIQHEDIKTYLSNHDVKELVQFIQKVIFTLSEQTIEKDFTKTYEEKLNCFSWDKFNLPFNANQLFEKLPKILPSSEYHGDFTLDNILYKTSGGFVCIDPITTEYNSYIFDLAKLRQDTICKWFIRNENLYFDSKLKIINDALSTFQHYNNDYLLILMLMRVLPYTNSKDKEFIESEILKLWK